MIRKTITVLSILIVCTACSSPEHSKKNMQETESKESVQAVEQEEDWVPDVYKTSELAELMRQMHADHMDVKHKIEQGETDLEKKGNYAFIHNAQPTDPNDDTPLYHTYADAFLIADSVVYTSKTTSDYKDNFNSMVNACVACHQNFCMGPINKIELLRIR